MTAAGDRIQSELNAAMMATAILLEGWDRWPGEQEIYVGLWRDLCPMVIPLDAEYARLKLAIEDYLSARFRPEVAGLALTELRRAIRRITRQRLGAIVERQRLTRPDVHADRRGEAA